MGHLAVKRGFTFIETVCVTLLLATASLVLLSLTDTFNNAIRYAKDTVILRIHLHNFQLALDKMLSIADHALLVDSAGVCESNDFPHIDSVYDSRAFSVMKERLLAAKDLNATPLSFSGATSWELSPTTPSTLQSARFVFYAHPTPQIGVELGDVLGSLLLSHRSDSNGHTYAIVELFSGDTLDASQRIAGYELELYPNVPGDFFIKTIQYWPLLGGYSVALPSAASSVVASNTSQLNIFRYGIFFPEVYFLR